MKSLEETKTEFLSLISDLKTGEIEQFFAWIKNEVCENVIVNGIEERAEKRRNLAQVAEFSL